METQEKSKELKDEEIIAEGVEAPPEETPKDEEVEYEPEPLLKSKRKQGRPKLPPEVKEATYHAHRDKINAQRREARRLKNEKLAQEQFEEQKALEEERRIKQEAEDEAKFQARLKKHLAKEAKEKEAKEKEAKEVEEAKNPQPNSYLATPKRRQRPTYQPMTTVGFIYSD
jgi:hypothetical protein